MFVWNAVTSGVIGNAAYDGIKATLGRGFDKLASYAREEKQSEFEIALLSILETNEKIAQELSQLRDGANNIQKQNHFGTGDNIGRDKVINFNQVSTPFEREAQFQENLNKRNALRDFMANSFQFIGSVMAGELRNLNVVSSRSVAKELDKAIRQSEELELVFIANGQLGEILAQIKHLGQLAWDNQVKVADFKKFLQCKDELESILLHLDESMVEKP